MRVDIGRICVLILCGCMYIDMDVMPNRPVYIQVALAVCRIDRTKWMAKKRRGKQRKRVRNKTQTRRETIDVFYEIEAIIALPRQPALTRWLEYVIERVKTFRCDGFHREARMRYVMHTTGPYAFNKFLKLKAQREIVKNMSVITCNVQKLQGTMTPQEMRSMDVISHDSCSWKTKQSETTVPITGKTVKLRELPVIRITRRVRVKSKQAQVHTSNRHQWVDSRMQDRLHDWIVVFIHAIRDLHDDIDEYLYEDTTGNKLFELLPPHVRARCGSEFTKLVYASDDSD